MNNIFTNFLKELQLNPSVCINCVVDTAFRQRELPFYLLKPCYQHGYLKLFYIVYRSLPIYLLYVDGVLCQS